MPWQTYPTKRWSDAALEGSHLKHVYPPYEVDASRAAFGRVLADIVDAGLLDDAPPKVRSSLFRTIDLELIDRSPGPRPTVIPTPPEAGHNQTIERWQEGLKCRLEEYIASSVNERYTLIGARCRLTVLNWGHLEEEFQCNTTLRSSNSNTGSKCVYQNSVILRDLIVPTSEAAR